MLSSQFSSTDSYLEYCRSSEFQKKGSQEKLNSIHAHLLDTIQAIATPCFLLPHLFHFIEQINNKKIVEIEYSLSLFEFWLNASSGISLQENRLIRGKIVGKYIPREEYQSFFPIGMDTLLQGPHFVAAHLSPDVDTTVASFLGWLDAFGAQVSDGLHYWSLPVGFSDGYLTKFFEEKISSQFWKFAPKKDPTCNISGIDLITQQPLESLAYEKVFLNTPFSEIEKKIQNGSSLQLFSDDTPHGFLLGSIDSKRLLKPILGTVSLRDFSSPEESKIAQQIEIVSILDHHKSSFSTLRPATVITADVQSSNTLLAEISCRLNKRYRSSRKALFFVDPIREIFEYHLMIIAILDDTDLLNKVTRRDVVILQELLNRLYYLIDENRSNPLSFDDLVEDSSFVLQAAQKLLQNDTLYSIYKKIYDYRESLVEISIQDEAKGIETSFFADTKEQNGICRIGQTKLFSKNRCSYEKNRQAILSHWITKSQIIFQDSQKICFFLQMISTISGAEEAFSSQGNSWNHSDEMWIFSPEKNSYAHLEKFFSLFAQSPTALSVPIALIVSEEQKELASFLRKLFDKNPSTTVNCDSSLPQGLVLLSFPAGKITSRKAQISPFLPKLEKERGCSS